VGQLSSSIFLLFLYYFIEIDYAYTTFVTIVNMLAFFKRKNKHILIRKFNAASNEKKNYHHSTFVHHKKSPINFFSLYRMKKNYIREKEKKIQEEKK